MSSLYMHPLLSFSALYRQNIVSMQFGHKIDYSGHILRYAATIPYLVNYTMETTRNQPASGY